MIYRIDRDRFLLYAIDYFTREELLAFNYVVISSSVNNGACEMNVVKIPELYPVPEIIQAWYDCEDKDILRKLYTAQLDPDKDSDQGSMANLIYTTFINPLLHHYDIVIICGETENAYIDVLAEHLKEKYAIEVIDLNELFTKGRVGEIYIDRKQIWNKAVDIRLAAGRNQIKALESTKEGREKLLGMMTKKMKLKKLKELGINVTAADKDNIDKLLVEEWVNEDEQ